MASTPKSFVPLEDDGFMVYSLSMPPGTALDRTTAVIQKLEKELAPLEAIDVNTSITGFNILSNSASPAYGLGFIKLKPKKDRGAVKDIEEIMNIVSGKLAKIKEGQIMVFRMPPVEGFGVTSGAEIVPQDRMARSPETLKAMSDKVIGQIIVTGCAIRLHDF